MNIFKEIALSFYSRDFYYLLARSKSGIGMRFILMLTLLSTLLLGGLLLWLDSHFHYLLDRVPEWTNQLPAVTHKDGKLSIDKPVPYYIQLGKTGDAAWIVVDTNYKITDIDVLQKFMKQNKVVMLITEDKLVTQKDSGNEHGVDIRDIDSKQDYTITHDDWKHYVNMFTTSGIPIIIAFSMVCFAIGAFISNMIFTFFNALVMLIVGAIMSFSLDLGDAMRLAAAYRIPVTLISYLTYIIALLGTHGAAFGWLVWLGYVIWVAVAIKPRVIAPAA